MKKILIAAGILAVVGTVVGYCVYKKQNKIQGKDFDVIVSLSSHFAKFAHTDGVPHIDDCLTPPKFFWQKDDRTLKSKEQMSGINKVLFSIYSFFMDTFLERLWQKWDRNAARKCTRIIANSKVVKKRIKKFLKQVCLQK